MLLKNRYEVGSEMGGQGSRTLFEARDLSLPGKRVALKRLDLPAQPVEAERLVRQFRQEAGIRVRLSHPNLAPVSDFFEEDGACYLVMEFIEGTPLDRLLETGAVAVETVLGWAFELCNVLEYLHTQEPPVIKSDLEPSRLIVDRWGRIRLIDFGLARLWSPSRGALFRDAGSEGFTPVEQYQGGGGGTDPRTDIYAFGATLHALLTGRVPPSSIAIAAGEAHLPRPDRIDPDVPPGLSDVVLKMMATRKSDRFATVGDVRRALAVVERARIRGDAACEAAPAAPPTLPPLPSPVPVASRHSSRAGGAVVVAPVPLKGKKPPAVLRRSGPEPDDGNFPGGWWIPVVWILILGGMLFQRFTVPSVSLPSPPVSPSVSLPSPAAPLPESTRSSLPSPAATPP